jgi:hypothetical protein
VLTFHRESLKSQVETNLHLAEDAKANLLLFKNPPPNSDPPTIAGNPDSQSIASGALSSATSVIDSPAQSLVPYQEKTPNVTESVASSLPALEEEMGEITCLSECPQELSGILVAQESTLRLAQDLLKITQVPTWTWGSSAATNPTDQPRHVPSVHRAGAPKPADQPTHVPSAQKNSSSQPIDQPEYVPSTHRTNSSSRLKESAVVNDSRFTKPSHEKPSQTQDDVLTYRSQADYKASVESLSPLQYLETEEDSQHNVSKPTRTDNLDIQAMIKKMLEETLTARNDQPTDQLRADPVTAARIQKPTLPESSFDTDYRDGSERLSKLEKTMLAERDEMVHKAARVEAERQAEKTRSEADKLAELEQLKAARMTNEHAPQVYMPPPPDPPESQENHVLRKLEMLLLGKQEEKRAEDAKFSRLEQLLIEQQQARIEREAYKRKAPEEDKFEKLEKLFIAQREEQILREAAVEAARKAEKAEADAKLKPSDAPKAPIRFKDAVGRKFSFPWHLCKTWKGMEELIKQAFLHVDVIGPHVHEGHYDLVGPDGEIILPQVWETIVQPDWAITMHMWPMPEPPPPPPPDKPEKGQKLKSGFSKLFERRFISQDGEKT